VRSVGGWCAARRAPPRLALSPPPQPLVGRWGARLCSHSNPGFPKIRGAAESSEARPRALRLVPGLGFTGQS
jgi:hypothetical protein